MVVAGSELPTAYRALALTLVFLQFLNPVALTIYFTPPKASHLPLVLSIVFAGIMMPLLIWYGLIDLRWMQPHPIPVSLFAFDVDRPGEFGSWSVLYKIFTPAILATLLYQQITHYLVKGRGILRAKLWEVFYLTSGLLRAVTLVMLLEWVPGNFNTIYHILSVVMAISLFLDTGIILIFASSRPVQFFRDYGLHLAGTRSPELERIVTEASRPEHLKNSKFQLAELAHAAHIPAYRVTQFVSQGLGMNIRELINHFRLQRYDALLAAQPKERKKTLLTECGFNSYAAYYAARKDK
jgi:AraC-like DNA-binding protein